MQLLTDLDYQLITPQSRRWKSHPRIMLVLHGQGDSLDPFCSLPHELELPEMHYLLINAPQPYDTGFAWYDSEPRHKKGIENSRQKLSLLIDDLIEQGWPSESIYLFVFQCFHDFSR